MTETIARVSGAAPEGPVPPQALEAERAVLAAMLLDTESVARAIEMIEPHVFYRVAHQKIFEAMTALFSRNEKIDLITLSEELRKRDELEAVGGPAALAQIMEYAATSANIEQHARIVHAKAVLRLLIKATGEIQQECYGGHDETAAILDRAEQRIFEITDERVRQGFISMKELMMPTMKHIEELAERKAFVTGVPSGYEDLDKLTAGFQRSDLVIIAGRPSMGKCLAEGSELVLDDGAVVSIEQLFQRRDARVGTLRADFKLDRAAPTDYVDDGFKPVFEVTTRLGRRVETTLPHPFLTPGGWKPLAELKVGDYVAVPRVLPVFGNDPMRECEIKLIAYLIGDGGLTGSSPRFTTTNEAIERDFIAAVESFGGCICKTYRSAARAPSIAVVADVTRVAASRAEVAANIDAVVAQSGRSARTMALAAGVSPASLTNWRQGKTVPDPETFGRFCQVLEVQPEALAPCTVLAARRHAPNALSRWLQELGLAGKGAGAKEIPAPVFRLPRTQLAMFLRHLFATDGWASVFGSGQSQLGYSTISERLARQVSHLLLRFGVIAKLRQRWVRYKDTRRPSWQLDITDAASIRRFIAEIGVFGKEAAVENVRRALDARREQTNVDLIPVEFWSELERTKGNLSWSELARRAGVNDSNIHVYQRALTRHRLARFAMVLENIRLLAIANSDVYWDRVESIVAAGIKQVYDLTIPETHNFVANDVCVHNTSFALNIAENAAIQHQKHVAILSLEMSKEQIALRLLCSQSEVPLYKVRSGHLSEAEFRRLVNLTGGLYKAPILIDDTAAPTVLEIRAKCRRLKAENRLDMVLIDYLQLIRSGGRSENRTQEISQITRALKGLAKELDIPVVALSQLSRAPEARGQGERRPQLSDLRESGCLTADTRVLRADTGAEVTMGELLARRERDIPVWTLDRDLKIAAGTMTHVFPSGVKPVFEMRLASGLKVKASANHPFLTLDGWRRLEELRVGDRLAAPRRIQGPSRLSEWSDARVIMLAHMIGDGCFASRQPVHYTSSDPENLQAVEAAAADFGIQPRRVRQENWWHVYLPSPYRLTHGRRNPISAWFEGLGIHGLRSYQKFIPETMFSLIQTQLALFLRHLWATDGCVHLENGRQARIYFASTSTRLVDDVRMLLLRFGVLGRVKRVTKAGYRPGYHLHVYGAKNQLRFMEEVGAFGPRRLQESAVLGLLRSLRANTNVDTVPAGVWKEVKHTMAARGVTARAFAQGLGMAYCGSTLYKHAPSRERMALVAQLLESETLDRLATSDVFWDRISAIEPQGEQPVFDATVPGTHNFIANGIVAHNSIEQDSDVVLFVFREEMYKRDDPSLRGKADIIIAKQRNGPTGDVKLTFLHEFTKFVPYSPVMPGETDPGF